MFKMLGALFASLFASRAVKVPPVPPRNLGPADDRRRDASAPSEKVAGFGRMVFPPMRHHHARVNPTGPGRVRGSEEPHYVETPHPVVAAPFYRMSQLAKQLEDISAHRETPRLSGKALKRRLRTLQHSVSVVANRIAKHERIVERRAAA